MSDAPPIPTTLAEAFVAMAAMLSEQEFAAIRAQQVSEFLTAQHFNLGLELRNRWLYSRKSPLRRLFTSARLWHTDNMSAALLRGFHQHLTEPSFDSEKCLLELRAPWDRKPSPAQLAAALEERTGEPITFVNPTEGDQGEPPWKLGELRHAESDWRAELLWDEAWTRFQCHDTTVSKRYFNEALWDALAGFGSPFAVKWRPLRPYRRMRMFDWARLQLERFWS